MSPTGPIYTPCTVRDLYSWEPWGEFDTLAEAYRHYPSPADGDYGVFANVARMRRRTADFVNPPWAFRLDTMPQMYNRLTD